MYKLVAFFCLLVAAVHAAPAPAPGLIGAPLITNIGAPIAYAAPALHAPLLAPAPIYSRTIIAGPALSPLALSHPIW